MHFNRQEAPVDWHPVDPRSWDLQQRGHTDWLSRGQTGAGRIVLNRPDFLRADLHGLRLAGARLVGPRMEGASIIGSDLSGTEIADGRMARLRLVTANVGGARWTGCSLEAASGDLASFAAANLEHCDLSRASLRRTSWVAATLVRCSFDSADLTDSCWDNARVTETSLRGASLPRVDGREHDRRGSAQGAVFAECDLRDLDVSRLRLGSTRFIRCRVTGMRGAPTLLGEVVFEACDRGVHVPDVGGGGAAWLGWT